MTVIDAVFVLAFVLPPVAILLGAMVLSTPTHRKRPV